MSILLGLISFMVTFPIAGFIVVFFFLSFLMKNRKKSFLLAADSITIFFVLSCWIKFTIIWKEFSFYWFVIAFFILFLLFLLFQYVLTGKIAVVRSFKWLWRCSFLLFFVLSILLTCVGLFIYIVDNM